LALFLVSPGRVRPLAPSRPTRKSELRTDLGYVLLSPATEALARLLTTLGIAGCALATGRAIDPGLLDGFGPVMQQPLGLVVLEMLLLGDLFYYWTHRLVHTVPWLWRFHAVHHSTRELGYSSALRAHPFEAYVHLVHQLPLLLLGFPLSVLAEMAPVIALYAMWIHGRRPALPRLLGWLVNTPAFHRLHHARDVRDGTRNYAGWFPLYDILFGTYRAPSAAPVECGIEGSDVPSDCLGQLLHPLHGAGAAPVRSANPTHPGMGHASERDRHGEPVMAATG
jgi:sterol desaturase/sphingolipid hydroxylase (fatty acid hydroxylase superfamily)